MKLTHPIIITPRLMAGVRVNDAWISVEWSRRPGDGGRARVRYIIDGPNFEYENDDLQTGVGGGHLQSMLGTLLAFLGAAAEAYDYERRTGRKSGNADLFPAEVTEWASQNSDEISMLQYEIEETPNLITA